MLRLQLIALTFIFVGGCGTVQTLRDSDFSEGCKVTEAQAKLGVLNQNGEFVACKVKCSEHLPNNFKYKYVNNRTGCNVEINND